LIMSLDLWPVRSAIHVSVRPAARFNVRAAHHHRPSGGIGGFTCALAVSDRPGVPTAPSTPAHAS
jgi:hypothetical protein